MNYDGRLADVTRTLVAAGYTVRGAVRVGLYTEVRCEHQTHLGATATVLLALHSGAEFTAREVEDLRLEATRSGRSLVLVAEQSGASTLSYDDLFAAVGGAVPSWRALAPGYAAALTEASQNRVPHGEKGEAWLIFERLVSDGLELVFGRRTRHLGGARRGGRVPDVIARLPSSRLITVDAKATGASFNAAPANLRALGEYFVQVRRRQRDGFGAFGALVVAPAYEQRQVRLAEISAEFAADYGGPVAFLSADTLLEMVALASNQPHLRNGVRWEQLLRGGLVAIQDVRRDFAEVQQLRMEVD